MVRTIKTMHYLGFRGIDLASDPTLCHKERSPYMLNMFKDYHSSFGRALETISGYRNRIIFPKVLNEKYVVYDMFFAKEYENGCEKDIPLIHVGKRLYKWDNYPKDINISKEIQCEVDENKIILEKAVSKVESVKINYVEVPFVLGENKKTITLNDKTKSKYALVKIIENSMTKDDAIFTKMSENVAKYFQINEKVYILTNGAIFVFENGEVKNIEAYVPTTYIGISSENMGRQKDFRNILSPYFKNTIVGDSSTTLFHLSEKLINEVVSVRLYGEELSVDDYSINLEKGEIIFKEAPKNPIEVGYDEGYAGIEIEVKKVDKNAEKLFQSMTIGESFDGRLFLGGSNISRNKVIYSALNDFSYFPKINFVEVGTDDSKITSITPSGEDLFVIKDDSKGGTIFTLNPFDTGYKNNPKAYMVKNLGYLIGAKCEAINFLNEPCFMSRLGIKAITNPNLKSIRQVENRSSLINSELISSNSLVKLFEWEGYLGALKKGYLYLGDSRVRYTNELGQMEFEWFKIGELAHYKDQYQRYTFAELMPKYLEEIETLAPKELIGQTANYPNSLGEPARKIIHKSIEFEGKTYNYDTCVTYGELAVGLENGEIEYEHFSKEYLVKKCDDKIGGLKSIATTIFSKEENIFFGAGGNLLSFNFDKKENGELAQDFYDFDGRIICSGVATKLDNLGYPNLTKSTVKKSLVVKCKTKEGSGAKVKVRTNDEGFELVGNLSNGYFNFKKVNFSDLSFNTSDQQIFMCNEAKKNWVEKQVYIYEDEFRKPFSVYYLSYQYVIKSKIKNK